MCRLGSMHSVRDRRTDRRTDNIITAMGDQYDRLTKMTKTNKKLIFIELGYLKIYQIVSVKCHLLINVLRVCSA